MWSFMTLGGKDDSSGSIGSGLRLGRIGILLRVVLSVAATLVAFVGELDRFLGRFHHGAGHK